MLAGAFGFEPKYLVLETRVLAVGRHPQKKSPIHDRRFLFFYEGLTF